jgi:hypothetical protein
MNTFYDEKNMPKTKGKRVEIIDVRVIDDDDDDERERIRYQFSISTN